MVDIIDDTESFIVSIGPQGQATVSDILVNPLPPVAPGTSVFIQFVLGNIGMDDDIWTQLIMNGTVILDETHLIMTGMTVETGTNYLVEAASIFHIEAGHVEGPDRITDVITADFNIPIIAEGQADVFDLSIPDIVEPNTPFTIEYKVTNIGSDDSIWAKIFANDVLIPESYWKEIIISNGTVIKTFTVSISVDTTFRVVAGHEE